jgi:hypothetical protein
VEDHPAAGGQHRQREVEVKARGWEAVEDEQRIAAVRWPVLEHEELVTQGADAAAARLPGCELRRKGVTHGAVTLCRG